jgi:hypothetical protein
MSGRAVKSWGKCGQTVAGPVKGRGQSLGTPFFTLGTSFYAPGVSFYAPGASFYALGTPFYGPGPSFYGLAEAFYPDGLRVLVRRVCPQRVVKPFGRPTGALGTDVPVLGTPLFPPPGGSKGSQQFAVNPQPS